MKKKGFTLVELVVGIAVSSIVLTMLGTLLFFTVQSNNRIMVDQKEFQNAATIRNIISTHYDRYVDETTLIDASSKDAEEVVLFNNEALNHKLTFKMNDLYLNNEILFDSDLDTKIEVLKDFNQVIYKITYAESKNITLVKGLF